MTDQAKAPYRVQVTRRRVRRTSGVGSDVECIWLIVRTGDGNPIASSITSYDTHKEDLDAGKMQLDRLR